MFYIRTVTYPDHGRNGLLLGSSPQEYFCAHLLYAHLFPFFPRVEEVREEEARRAVVRTERVAALTFLVRRPNTVDRFVDFISYKLSLLLRRPL